MTPEEKTGAWFIAFVIVALAGCCWGLYWLIEGVRHLWNRYPL